MNSSSTIYLGTDSGATTSKTGGIWADGSVITTRLAQSATNAQAGTHEVVRGWIAGMEVFLADNGLTWAQVGGVGLALPGPYRSYGVLGKAANFPDHFDGWNFFTDYEVALAAAAGRPIPLVTDNDGRYGGVAEARELCQGEAVGTLMLAPGSGLGCSYVDARGFPLIGDTLSGTELAHMPAPLQLLGLPTLRCGCGREWGCYEAYTSISGLPQLLEYFLPQHPGHFLASSDQSPRQRALSLRGLAQEGDALAVQIFDSQATALGYLVASMARVLDPTFVVIGGGLMDPEATTASFRARYLEIVDTVARPMLEPTQRERMRIVAARLGELSQAIGAAIMAAHHQGSDPS